MFIRLFLKECKQVLKSTTYYVLVICIILFYNAQIGDFKMTAKPQPGQEDYGRTYSKDEKVIMNKTVQVLVGEYAQNNYIAYPLGFYKTVTLNNVKQSKMSDIVTEVTGLTKEEVITAVEDYLGTVTPLSDPIEISVNPNLSYNDFKKLMEKADKLLGGGSRYSKSFMMSNASVPMTYEEALQEYHEILEKDHLSGAYARLFCDYLGIVLAILPIFLAVTRGLRDKRAGASQIIYSRKASSFIIITSRYLSMLVMIILPIVMIGITLTAQCTYYGIGADVSVDHFAFAKYIFGWLLPSIMISTSVGVLITELTETALGIIVVGFWWFVSLFMGAANMMGGGYGWNLIPRHNTLGNYQAFHDNFDMLVMNRIVYAIVAILLAVAAIIIYDRKRKGKLIIHGKILSNRKSKSEV